MFNRNNVKTCTEALPAVATDASALLNLMSVPAPAQVTGVKFIASASQPAATATAEGLNIVVYKNASSTASVVASLNTSGTGITANNDQTVPITTTSSLRKITVGDVLFAEITGGAAMGSTVGGLLEIEYVYGYEDA